MLKSEALQRETELLNAIYNSYTAMEFAVDRTNKEQNGVGDMLSFDFNAGVNFEPALANFYFLPQKDEEDIMESYFVESIAVIDEIENEEKKAEMLQAVNVLNFNVAYGNFQFDPDINILTYKYLIPVHASMSRENALMLLDKQTLVGIGIVNLYIAPINALLADRITWDEYVYALAALVSDVEE